WLSKTRTKADQLSALDYLSRHSLGVGGSTKDDQVLPWNYSFTVSICLSITRPVKRSIAAWTQLCCSPSTTKLSRRPYDSPRSEPSGLPHPREGPAPRERK